MRIIVKFEIETVDNLLGARELLIKRVFNTVDFENGKIYGSVKFFTERDIKEKIKEVEEIEMKIKIHSMYSED